MDARDRAAKMGHDLTQAVAVPDVRRHDPLAAINRADKILEHRSRQPHHRPREPGTPRHTRKPPHDKDILAGNKRKPRRRTLHQQHHHRPVAPQHLRTIVATASEQPVDSDDPRRRRADHDMAARPAPLHRPTTELRAYFGRWPLLVARQVMRPQARWSVAR